MIRIIVRRICVIGGASLCAIAFSPLVLAPSNAEPFFLGMPRTLWAGMLISLGLLIFTVIGAFVVEGGDGGEEN